MGNLLMDDDTELSPASLASPLVCFTSCVKLEWPSLFYVLLPMCYFICVTTEHRRSALRLASLVFNITGSDAQDIFGRTPLSWAAEEGHVAVMQLLFDNNANLNSKDAYGHTLLHHASMQRVLALQDYKIPLMLSIQRIKLRWRMALQEQQLDQPSTPLASQVPYDVYGTISDSLVPVGYIIGEPHELKVVRFLLERDADIGSHGQRLLSWAAQHDHEDIVHLLLTTGQVEANARDGCGQTPLAQAAKGGHKAVVKLLADAGAVDTTN